MIDTTRFELSNGLRVVHNYDGNTAMVAVNVLYNVGSRDEDSNLTGLAHLFEHLMFGGSVNIPDFDGAIERAGGKNNAWTSNDFTNFYDIVPAQNAETAFWLESDRMLSPAFTERTLEVQRSVVIEEFKQQCLNRPYGDMSHHLRKMIYKVHPYQWPVIGKEPSHIAKVQLSEDQLKDDMKLVEDLSLDSISFVNMIVNLEATYGFSFDDEYISYDMLKTVKDVADYVSRKTGQG